jgi:hypothetical protein
MERDAVSFAIEDDSPETVGAYLVRGLDDCAAVGFDGRYGFVETPLCVQVDQGTRGSRRLVGLGKKAAADVAFVAGQQADRHARELLLLNLAPEDGRVKADRPFEVQDWNIDPNELIGHRDSPV